MKGSTSGASAIVGSLCQPPERRSIRRREWSRVDVWILESAQAVAVKAADLCAELIQGKPDARLGLATGTTPQALYAELIRRNQRGELSFSRVETFNLDEYLGLGPQHPQSFHHAMRDRFFAHVDIDPARTHLPAGDAADPAAEAASYEALIEARGGIDLQILGIGRNGHIGFNEPGSSLGSRTRVKTLSRATLRDNRLGRPDSEAPIMAITMGIATILDARALLVLATGEAKAAAVAAALEGPLAASCPASAIQLHPDATVVLDPGAAADLRLTDYYELVDRARRSLTSRSS
jgi:glucosamine-6-phosphate deaminase